MDIILAGAPEEGKPFPSLTRLVPEDDQRALEISQDDPRYAGTSSQPTTPYDPIERKEPTKTNPAYEYGGYPPASNGYFGGPPARDARGSLSSGSYVESSRHSSQSTARSSLSSAVADLTCPPPPQPTHQQRATWPEQASSQGFVYPHPVFSPRSRAAKPDLSPPYHTQQAPPLRTSLPPIRYSPNTQYAGLRRDSMPNTHDEYDRRGSYPHILGGGSPGSTFGTLPDIARRGSHPSVGFAPYMTNRSALSNESLGSAERGYTAQAVGPSSSPQESTGKPKKRRGNLSRKATNMLKTWLNEHVDHPYPSEDEKLALSEQTELTIAQISNWFINARRRILAPRFASKNQSAAWNEIKMNHHIHGGRMPEPSNSGPPAPENPPSVSSTGSAESPEAHHFAPGNSVAPTTA